MNGSTHKTLKEADVTELREHARLAIGLEVDGTENTATILNKMRQAGVDPDHESFRVMIFDQSTPAEPGTAEGARELRFDPATGQDRWYRAVTVQKQDTVSGQQGLPVRVNGIIMIIPRGSKQWVPEEYAEALAHAVEVSFAPSDTGLGDTFEKQSYPHAIH